MDIFFKLSLLFCISLIIGNSAACQPTQNVNKLPEITKKRVVAKDSVVYNVVLSDKDTIDYDVNKKLITATRQSVVGNLKRNRNVLQLSFSDGNRRILSIQATIHKTKADTIAVFSPDFIEKPAFLIIQNYLYCDIDTIKINDYDNTYSCAYTRKIISKFFH